MPNTKRRPHRAAFFAFCRALQHGSFSGLPDNLSFSRTSRCSATERTRVALRFPEHGANCGAHSPPPIPSDRARYHSVAPSSHSSPVGAYECPPCGFSYRAPESHRLQPRRERPRMPRMTRLARVRGCRPQVLLMSVHILIAE